MGRLSDLVRGAIESRLRMMSRGASSTGLFRRYHAVPPLLSSDFVLEFRNTRYGTALHTDNFMLTDLNGLDGVGLSWAPDSHDGLSPQPATSVSYFTLQFYISSDSEDSPSSFPTLFLYERQFTDDGLLTPPGEAAEEVFGVARAYETLTGESVGYDVVRGSGYYRREEDKGEWFRPTAHLLAVFPPDKDDPAAHPLEVELCRFNKCVFGTPHQSLNMGQVAGMTWSQQVGFRDVTWGSYEGSGANTTFWDRVRLGASSPAGPSIVKPFKR